jgi:hypothetical protein
MDARDLRRRSVLHRAYAATVRNVERLDEPR